MILEFTKMQGTGNDFVIFDTFSQSISLNSKQMSQMFIIEFLILMALKLCNVEMAHVVRLYTLTVKV